MLNTLVSNDLPTNTFIAEKLMVENGFLSELSYSWAHFTCSLQYIYFETPCSCEAFFAFTYSIAVQLSIRSVNFFRFFSCTVGWTRFHSQICQHGWAEGRTKTGFDQADRVSKKTGFAFVGFVYTRRRICQISVMWKYFPGFIITKSPQNFSYMD